jgi:cell division protein FtsQ
LVKINFIEREPVGCVPYLGSNLIVDNESYVLDIIKDMPPHNLPIIKGLRFNNYELGQKLSTENPESLNAVITILDVIKTSDKKDRFKLLDIINSIDVGDLKKIIFLIDSRIVLNLGDIEELEYKIAATKQILLKNVKKEDKGLLDFTIGENPTFIPDLN